MIEPQKEFEFVATGETKRSFNEDLKKIEKEKVAKANGKMLVSYGAFAKEKFGVLDKESLVEKINDMDDLDLKSFAKRVGASHDLPKKLIKESILKQFKRFIAENTYQPISEAKPSLVLDSSNPKHQKLIDYIG